MGSGECRCGVWGVVNVDVECGSGECRCGVLHAYVPTLPLSHYLQVDRERVSSSAVLS